MNFNQGNPGKIKATSLVSRRDFLKLSGICVFGSSILPVIPFSNPGKPKAGRLSLQLYTVRNEIIKDFPGTMRRIREIGFRSVETAFWPDGMTIKNAAKHIKDAGLKVSGCHVELPVGDKKQIMLDTAAAFGSGKMIWHGWPEDKRYSTLDGTMELVSIYNEASGFALENGLQFGLHNHWWEYRNKVGGRFVYEVLLENTDKNIFFEIDTYWVKVGGQDPAAIIKKFGSRAPMLHIKDGPAKFNDLLAIDNPDPMTPVGQGTQNFPAIVKAADGNTEWMVVELDKSTINVFDALKQSVDYLISNKLAVAE